MTIRGGKPRPAMFKSHGDHRIAMAAAVAANAMPGESTVRGWQAVAVSYPGFADDLGTLAGGNGCVIHVVAIDGPVGIGQVDRRARRRRRPRPRRCSTPVRCTGP